jgi:hypothetical protein
MYYFKIYTASDKKVVHRSTVNTTQTRGVRNIPDSSLQDLLKDNVKN